MSRFVHSTFFHRLSILIILFIIGACDGGPESESAVFRGDTHVQDGSQLSDQEDAVAESTGGVYQEGDLAEEFDDYPAFESAEIDNGVIAPLSDPPEIFPALAADVGEEFVADTYTTGDQKQAAVAMDSNGDFVVTWQSDLQDGSSFGIYGQRYNSSAAAQGSEFAVNTYATDSQANAAVAMSSSGGFVVAWASYGPDGNQNGIFAQRYDSSGAAQGGEFQVNIYTSHQQWMPTVAMDSAGNFVVAWSSYGNEASDYGIFAQRYNSSGVAQGSEFQVNTYTTGTQNYPVAAMDSDGDFVIVWQSDGQDGDGYGVYGQRFNASGVAQGSEFQVNTYTTIAQLYPDVAMDSSGNFVVVWQSDGQDGADEGIYAQRYNSSGVAQGSEFRANTTTDNIQQYPTVAMGADGEFIIAWGSTGQDGSLEGIYAQRYNASGVAQGSEFRINDYTTSIQTTPDAAMSADGQVIIAWHSYNVDSDNYGVAGKMLECVIDANCDDGLPGTLDECDDGMCNYTPTTTTTTVVTTTTTVTTTTQPEYYADFSADVTSGEAPLTVTFTDQSNIDVSCNITNYFWEYGDGWTDEGNTQEWSEVEHEYTAAGTYTVRYEIQTENCGTLEEIKTDYIEVTAPPDDDSADDAADDTGDDSDDDSTDDTVGDANDDASSSGGDDDDDDGGCCG